MRHPFSIFPLFLLSLPISCGREDLPVEGEGGVITTIFDAETEGELREFLGIPEEAEYVLILSQSVHLDIDWLLTFGDYYNLLVESIFFEAIDLLEEYPTYYYSIGEILFLQRFLEENPPAYERVLPFVQEGRLRIVGGGMTSPDTLLPTGESLLMDLYMGNRFTLEEFGIKPSTAWQPDSFGHSPSLPGLLREAGYTALGFGRADDITEETLLEQGSWDFLWQGVDGETILAHFMPGSYWEGDLIDYDDGDYTGSTRTALSNLHEMVEERLPFSPTGYIFISIGADFVPPKRNLPLYVEAWNEEKYAGTGVFAVLATFEDYMRFVSFHEEELPVLPLDINPYWMGFYATRPILKGFNREASSLLFAASTLNAALLYLTAAPPSSLDEVEDALWYTVFGNHHDDITGTGADNVFEAEQVPFYEEAVSLAGEGVAIALEELLPNIDTTVPEGLALLVFNPISSPIPMEVSLSMELEDEGVRFLEIRDRDGNPLPSSLSVEETHEDGSLKRGEVRFTAKDLPGTGLELFQALPAEAPPSTPSPLFIEGDGETILFGNGIITAELRRQDCHLISFSMEEGGEVIRGGGKGNEIILYEDGGDAWALGVEEGEFDAIERTGEGENTCTIEEHSDHRVVIESVSPLPSARIIRRFFMVEGIPYLLMETVLALPEGLSATALFETSIEADGIYTSIPYGITKRPFAKVFDPTFWPSLYFAALEGEGQGVALMNRSNPAVRGSADGDMEVILLRNTPSVAEIFSVGTDSEERTLAYALLPFSGDLFEEKVPLTAFAFNNPCIGFQVSPSSGEMELPISLATTGEGGILGAMLPGEGEGVIIRLFRYSPEIASLEVGTYFDNWTRICHSDLLGNCIEEMDASPSSFTIEFESDVETLLIAP